MFVLLENLLQFSRFVFLVSTSCSLVSISCSPAFTSRSSSFLSWQVVWHFINHKIIRIVAKEWINIEIIKTYFLHLKGKDLRFKTSVHSSIMHINFGCNHKKSKYDISFLLMSKQCVQNKNPSWKLIEKMCLLEVNIFYQHRINK